MRRRRSPSSGTGTRGGAVGWRALIGGERRRGDVAARHWSEGHGQRTCPSRMDMSDGARRKTARVSGKRSENENEGVYL